tara:strand:+ start:69 stop:899 length:831 start_codon:yes stop_codon:yes gene_type:complete
MFCFRCGKKFDRKIHLNRHLGRRKICVLKYLDVSYEEIRENYDELLECFKILNLTTEKNNREQPKNNRKSQNNNRAQFKIYKCKYCDKIFKYQQSKSRHEVHRCNKNPINNQKVVNIIETQNINNIQNNIQNNNTQNNTIIINSYGKEDISYLKDKHFLKILMGPFRSIQKTNNAIHFNGKHPENMNIMITNKKEPYAKIYKNNKWCLIEKKKIIQDMIEKAFDLIDTYYENEGKFKLNERKNKIYKRFLNYYDNDPNFMRRIEKDIELMILNEGL